MKPKKTIFNYEDIPVGFYDKIFKIYFFLTKIIIQKKRAIIELIEDVTKSKNIEKINSLYDLIK